MYFSFETQYIFSEIVNDVYKKNINIIIFEQQ